MLKLCLKLKFEKKLTVENQLKMEVQAMKDLEPKIVVVKDPEVWAQAPLTFHIFISEMTLLEFFV